MTGLTILGTGRCLPVHAVTNQELSRRVDTSDQWITSRTGIEQRYFCEAEDCTSLAIEAGRRAMAAAGVTPQQVGVCLVATFSPQYAIPATACLVQAALGLPEDIPCFDLNAACSGFLYGLETARALLVGADRPCGLVIGSEQLSRLLDFDDRTTCVLFGDGAGAVVVRPSDHHPYTSLLGARGETDPLWAQGAGGFQRSTLHMEGQTVFRFAVEIIPHCIEGILKKSGLTLDEIDWVVCHQANSRIIDHVVKKLGAPPEKFYKNMQRYGNTSAASIPIALDELAESGLLLPSTRVLCVGFGGGLTWGGTLLTF